MPMLLVEMASFRIRSSNGNQIKETKDLKLVLNTKSLLPSKLTGVAAYGEYTYTNNPNVSLIMMTLQQPQPIYGKANFTGLNNLECHNKPILLE